MITFNLEIGRSKTAQKTSVVEKPPVEVEKTLTAITEPAKTAAYNIAYHTYQSLYRKEIEDWKAAREARYNVVNPQTYLMQQLYTDAMLDNILRRNINNRILRVTNKHFQIKDSTGKIDDKRSKFVQTKLFKKIVKKALESKFYGYSVIYINDFKFGKINGFKDIPRECIIPETGKIVKDASGEGFAYTDFPNLIIYMSLGDNAIGELEALAPLTILKRHSWASWDEFEQIFGLPLRIAKTMGDTGTQQDNLEYWMQTMGSAAYAILPKTVDIEIKENNRPDAYMIFDKKRNAVNEEIAIGVNGQTMTTMEGSSRSQSETHMKTQDEITDEDIADAKSWFDDEFAPVLRNLGYDIPEGFYLDITSASVMPIVERIKVDSELMKNGYKPTRQYVEETYNVKLDEVQDPVTVPPANIPPDKKPKDKNSLSFFD